MSDAVPNLLRHRRRAAEDVLCDGHCEHVGFMWRDFKRMERAFWVLFAAIVGLIVKDVLPGYLSKARETTPVTHAGERLAPDRIDEPTR